MLKTIKTMILRLCRNYNDVGTTGLLYDEQGELICYTIELPWKNNELRVSCIPEGTYGLVKRYSAKFKDHVLLTGTAPRSLILIHPANDASDELAGCIAPVTKLTGPDSGSSSRVQFEKIRNMVYAAIDRGEECFIEIKENK